ncbi:MAG: hypothetical protein VX265_16970 [Myxococcota bacterium]|nr:hypothetical protein [Myxococcota bacterium]MEC8424743.1 hypothetical protein [Myxococcota bacterium]
MPPLLSLLIAKCAFAGPFTPKTMIGPWPERQVDQTLVLPKGWLQLAVTGDHKVATRTRDRGGVSRDMEPGVSFRYARTWLRVDQGFSRRVRLYAHAPLVRAALVRDGETAVATTALGDVRGGFVVQPWLDARVLGAVQVELKAPTGVEWPGGVTGGAGNTSSFLTGTGTTDLNVTAHGQLGLGSIGRLRGQAGYDARLPGIVGYVVEVDGMANGWLNPGDVWRVRLEGTAQVGSDVAVTAGGTARFVGWYRSGTSGPSVWRAELYDIPASYGNFFDVDGRVSFEPVPHFEVAAVAGYQLRGGYTGVFSHLGLDDYSPLPGVTVGLDLVTRW